MLHNDTDNTKYVRNIEVKNCIDRKSKYNFMKNHESFRIINLYCNVYNVSSIVLITTRYHFSSSPFLARLAYNFKVL